jgi:hypothetical protein
MERMTVSVIAARHKGATVGAPRPCRVCHLYETVACDLAEIPHAG